MSVYVRPKVEPAHFRDSAGRDIDYGNRWRGCSPPDNTYSVVTHPERFAPLITIAEALISHLAQKFDVDISRDAAFGADTMHEFHGVVGAARLTPSNPWCAPLTFVFTDPPSVTIHAGLLHDFPFPDCSCDACDESWQSQADRIEAFVFAVTSGGYTESVHPWPARWFSYSVAGMRGGSSGGSKVDKRIKHRVGSAKAVLKQLRGPWMAWPERPR